jgi:hypothetical protein
MWPTFRRAGNTVPVQQAVLSLGKSAYVGLRSHAQLVEMLRIVDLA